MSTNYYMLRSSNYSGFVIVVEATPACEKTLGHARKAYPCFKGKRKKTKSLIIPDSCLKNIGKVMPYDDWYNALWKAKNAAQEKAAKEAKAKIKAQEEAELKKQAELEKRPDKPMSGDYLQLYQFGRLSEDFTFVHELVADHGGEKYIVVDVMQREYLVEANHDRDNGTRRAFRQILTGGN